MDNLIINETNSYPGKGSLSYYAEASTLGFPVGMIARRLPTTLGNGEDFILNHTETGYFVYRQAFGNIYLTVWND